MTDTLLANVVGAPMLRLRAAAVADRHGRVVVLMPAEGSVDRHVEMRPRSGNIWLDGEFIEIDAQGRVRTLPRSPSSARTDGDVDLPAPGGFRLSKVVLLLDDDNELSSPFVKAAGMEQALLALVRYGSGLDALRTPLRTIAALLEASGGAIVLHGHDVGSLDDAIADLLDGTPPLKMPRVPAAVDTAEPPRLDARNGGLFRAPFIDAIRLPGGRTAILHPSGEGALLRVLDRTEAALWGAANGAPRGELLAEVGQPISAENGQRSTADALTTLLDLRLLLEEQSWMVCETAAWAVEEKRTTVLDLGAGPSRLLALDGSAHWIWSILAEHSCLSERELIRECAHLFDVPESNIVDDVLGLLDRLRQEGLLRPA